MFYNSKILKITNETPSVRRFLIQYDSSNTFSFIPGQFVIIRFPIGEEFIERSYSIANIPNGEHTLELCIVLKPGGAATTYLFNLVEGDSILMSEPQGNFFLPETIEKDICFISTGTGVAPFRSMIGQMLKSGLEHRNIYLIFGNRRKEDILYHNEFLNWANEHPEFKYIPVLSREEHWEGAKGYVHHVYQNLFSDRRDAWFYISGWSEMIKETRHNLKELGYTRQQYKVELYD